MSEIYYYSKGLGYQHKYIKMVKMHKLVKILVNMTNFDKNTCEISVFSCQLVQTIHCFKI